MKKILFIFCLISTACNAPLLAPGARNVRAAKSDPPIECEDRGAVTGESGWRTNNQDVEAQNSLRNAAAMRGANYVRIDVIRDGNNITRYVGTAFKCPEANSTNTSNITSSKTD